MTGAAERDARLVRRALALAERGWGRVAPNPMVGAVVAREDEVLGEGWHAEFGGEHAEVAALERAGGRASGADLYVTLEPCHHHGKTPPCTEAILESRVARVVVACRDPHPLASGGIRGLRAAGMEVITGVEAEAAVRLNAPFLWRHLTGEPFVALKLALTLDGKIARREGRRTAITGPAAAAETHRLRAGHDAVLVGSRTARIDDPLLTARGEPAPRRPPVRVVLDSRLALPPAGRLARTAGEAPVWAVTAAGADAARRATLEGAGVRVLEVPPGPAGVDAPAALRALGAEGIGSVLVEGGGRLAASLLAADLVHRLHLLVAPVAFGPEGVDGFPEGGALEPEAWEVADRKALGRDTLLVLERTDAFRRLREAVG